MKRAGVKYASFSFDYTFRNYNVNWEEELSFLNSMVVLPGKREYSLEEVEKYIEFLNQYSYLIDFAMEIPGYDMTDVDVPLMDLYQGKESYYAYDYIGVTKQSIKKYLATNHLGQLKKYGYSIHGLGTYNNKIFDSANTSEWQKGKFGYSYYFEGKTLYKYSPDDMPVRKYIVRKLKERNDINWGLVLQNDWREVALMNCIAFTRYQEDLCRKK